MGLLGDHQSLRHERTHVVFRKPAATDFRSGFIHPDTTAGSYS